MRPDTAQIVQALRRIVDEYGLETKDIADKCRVSEHTVRSWLRPDTNANYRVPHPAAIELLYMKLDEPTPFT